jgi:hypothetical protein
LRRVIWVGGSTTYFWDERVQPLEIHFLNSKLTSHVFKNIYETYIDFREMNLSHPTPINAEEKILEPRKNHYFAINDSPARLERKS